MSDAKSSPTAHSISKNGLKEYSNSVVEAKAEEEIPNLELIFNKMQISRWDWAHKLDTYDRSFLHPKNDYMSMLDEKVVVEDNAKSICYLFPINKDRLNQKWREFKEQELSLAHRLFPILWGIPVNRFDIDTLYRANALAHQLLAMPEHSDHKAAKRLYELVQKRLCRAENEKLRDVQNARDNLYPKLADLKGSKLEHAIIHLFCRGVSSTTREEEKNSLLHSFDNFEGVLELMTAGKLRLFAGTTFIDRETKLTATQELEAGNVAKAFAQVLLQVGKNGELTFEFVDVVNKKIVEEIERKNAPILRLNAKRKVLDYIFGWINFNMRWNLGNDGLVRNGKIDGVTLAILAHFAISIVQFFDDANNRTAQLIQNFILLKHGYPPIALSDKPNNFRQLSVLLEEITMDAEVTNRDPRRIIAILVGWLEDTITELAKISEMEVIFLADDILLFEQCGEESLELAQSDQSGEKESEEGEQGKTGTKTMTVVEPRARPSGSATVIPEPDCFCRPIPLVECMLAVLRKYRPDWLEQVEGPSGSATVMPEPDCFCRPIPLVECMLAVLRKYRPDWLEQVEELRG